MKKNLLKCLSLVLCMAMCLGMCGTTAFATQGGADEPQVVQELGTDEELSIETVETDKTAQINEGETLYERLMAAETAAEMADILDEQEEAPSFTEDELSALIAKANAFEESDDKTALLANLEYLATGKNETDKIDSTTTEPDDKTALIDATYDSTTRTITMTVGDTYTLTPGITYTEQSFWGGSNTKTASGNFTSNEESVATVKGISNNQYGSSYGRNSYTSATVTAVAAGKTTITFSYTTGGGPNAQTQTATYTVIVNAATGISISGSDSMTVGETIALTTSANKTEDTISSIEWSSSNSAIATVDANGNVKGVANGEVTITATAKMSDGTTYTATKTIMVNPKAQEDGTTRVYLYVTVTTEAEKFSINGQKFETNPNGWYTIGYIDVPNSVLPDADDSQFKKVGSGEKINCTEKYLNTIKNYATYNNVTWFTTNQTLSQAIFDQIDWYEINISLGAADYPKETDNGWHLDGKIIIKNSIITLTAASAEYPYDGTEKTASGLETSKLYKTGTDPNGTSCIVYTDGEYTVYIYDVTTSNPSAINVGTYPNTINVSGAMCKVYYSGSEVNNRTYTIKGVDGTLKITDRSEKYTLTLTGASTTATYDGTSHSATGLTNTDTNSEKDGLQFKVGEVEYTVSGYTTSNPSSTDVCSKTNTVTITNVTITDANGNNVTGQFSVSKADGTLTISKRGLTITADSAEKVYDGTPLTKNTYTVNGLKGSDAISSVTVTGSQTLVGSSNNVPSNAVFSSGSADNYEITYAKGTLEVTDGTDTEPVDPKNVVTKTHENKEYKLGETVTFTINVTNIYNTKKTVEITELKGVTIADGTGYTVSNGTATATMAAGNSLTVNATYTITEADIKAGSFTNTVKVSFTNGKDFENTDKVEVENEKNSLKVEKTSTLAETNGTLNDNKAAVGDVITYMITVKNTGNVTQTNIKVEDEMLGWTGENVKTIDKLGVDATETLTGTYTVTQADVNAGAKIINTAMAKSDNNTDPTPGSDPGVDPETPVVIPDTPTPSSGGSSSTTINDEDVPLVSVVDTEDIDDEDVPLVGTVDGVDIDDDDVPLANVPKTRDEIMDWCLVAAIACMVAAGAVVVRRKKRG